MPNLILGEVGDSANAGAGDLDCVHLKHHDDDHGDKTGLKNNMITSQKEFVEFDALY